MHIPANHRSQCDTNIKLCTHYYAGIEIIKLHIGQHNDGPVSILQMNGCFLKILWGWDRQRPCIRSRMRKLDDNLLWLNVNSKALLATLTCLHTQNLCFPKSPNPLKAQIRVWYTILNISLTAYLLITRHNRCYQLENAKYASIDLIWYKYVIISYLLHDMFIEGKYVFCLSRVHPVTLHSFN